MSKLLEKNKELMAILKKIYPKGRLVFYDTEHNHVVIRPFRTDKMEFGIFLEQDGDCKPFIMRTPNFDTAAHDGGDNDAVIYFIEGDQPSLGSIVQQLDKYVKKYVQEEQEFYDEGVACHMDFGVCNYEELKNLASVAYSEGFLEDHGIKEVTEEEYKNWDKRVAEKDMGEGI